MAPAAIHKAAAMVFRENAFLMVRKRGQDTLTSLGGKIEAGETEEEALLREIQEEAGCGALIHQKLGDFESAVAFDPGKTIRLSIYQVELDAEPVPQAGDEVVEFIYVPRDWQRQGIKLTSVITEHVIPSCRAQGLLQW